MYEPGTLKPIIPRVSVCVYCGLHHKLVEAGGVHHCPNPCCLGPGQSYQRSRLESYKKVDAWKHTIDLDELFEVGICKALDGGDPAIITQTFISVVREYWWRREVTS